MIPPPGPANTWEARAALEYAIGTVSRANPIVAAWRWRYELAAAATPAAAWIALGTAAAAAVTGGLAAPLAFTVCFPRRTQVPRGPRVVHRDGASRPQRSRPGVDPHPLRQAPLHLVDAKPTVRRARLHVVPSRHQRR